MIKQYNKFMYIQELKIEIGQLYFVDGKRMKLSSVNNDRYIFVKGDDIVNVPKNKLSRYVSERKRHILKFDEKSI